jgi:hypothetical protein
MNAALAFRVVGDAANRREIVSYRKATVLYAAAAPSVQPELPAFLSAFAYPTAFKQHVDATGSTAGYSGPVAVPSLNFDVDRDDLDVALRDTRRLSQFLADRYAAGPVVHYSGSKGFHLSIPTAGFIEPAPDNHLIAKALACRLAGEVGIEVDEGVFDRVRLWRAPNSRHRRTGRHKVRIDADDLLFLNADQVRRLALEPVPYDLPAPSSPPPRLVADWNQVAAAVRGEGERQGRRIVASGDAQTRIDPLTRLSGAAQVRRTVANGEGRQRINPLTRSLLADPTSIRVGERHKTILSAAADLASFPTIDDLVAALLTPPGLDTGLPPKEVSRQIACGIAMAGRQRLQLARQHRN